MDPAMNIFQIKQSLFCVYGKLNPCPSFNQLHNCSTALSGGFLYSLVVFTFKTCGKNKNGGKADFYRK
jgi:hypothetical protein